MNRMIKAAAAVAAFGLAGVMAATPAQAQEHRLATESAGDGSSGGSSGGSGGVLGDLLGGLFGGEKDTTATGASRSVAPGDTPGAYVPRGVGGPRSPLPPLSPGETNSSVAGLPVGARLLGALPGLGGLGGLTAQVPGASRAAQGRSPMSSVEAPLQGGQAVVDRAGVFSVERLLGGTLYGAVRSSGTRAPTAYGGTSYGTSYGPSAELVPVVGRLMPAEMAPVVETLPGTARIATLDRSARLFQSVATARTGVRGEQVTLFGRTAEARTGAVTGYSGRG
ncbi:hypothetical protein [Nonomuraea sp. NPDC048916]|uniref:hypothetical protein n=1 Tax=Nonomuraea sp. NPDC048916 TaxID=3154232 RepID=UPI00340F3298